MTSKFDPELLKKLKDPKFFSHSDEREQVISFLEDGSIPKNFYYTVNRENEFRECQIIFDLYYDPEDIDEIKSIFKEDKAAKHSAMEIFETEFEAHDQVIIKEDVDFMLNADLKGVSCGNKKIETDDLEEAINFLKSGTED